MIRIVLFLLGSLMIQAAEVGIVDYASLVLMHPEMRDFHFPSMRFFKPLQAERGDSISEQKLRRSMNHQDALQAEAEFQRCLNNTSEINQKLMGLSGRFQGLALSREEDRLAASHAKKCREQAAPRLEQYWHWFLNPAESRQKLLGIAQEIAEVVQKVRESKKLVAVFPGCYTRDSVWPAIRPDALYQRGEWELESGLERLLSGRFSDQGVKMDRWLSTEWLQKRDQIEGMLPGLLASGAVLSGGTDVTMDTLEILWGRHRLDPQIRDALGRAVKAWLSGEDGQVESP